MASRLRHIDQHTWETGDGNGDGVIDGTDFLIWQGNFGADLRQGGSCANTGAQFDAHCRPVRSVWTGSVPHQPRRRLLGYTRCCTLREPLQVQSCLEDEPSHVAARSVVRRPALSAKLVPDQAIPGRPNGGCAAKARNQTETRHPDCEPAESETRRYERSVMPTTDRYLHVGPSRKAMESSSHEASRTHILTLLLQAGPAIVASVNRLLEGWSQYFGFRLRPPSAGLCGGELQALTRLSVHLRRRSQRGCRPPRERSLLRASLSLPGIRDAARKSRGLRVPTDETPSSRRMREIRTSGGMREEGRP